VLNPSTAMRMRAAAHAIEWRGFAAVHASDPGHATGMVRQARNVRFEAFRGVSGLA